MSLYSSLVTSGKPTSYSHSDEYSRQEQEQCGGTQTSEYDLPSQVDAGSLGARGSALRGRSSRFEGRNKRTHCIEWSEVNGREAVVVDQTGGIRRADSGGWAVLLLLKLKPRQEYTLSSGTVCPGLTLIVILCVV